MSKSTEKLIAQTIKSGLEVGLKIENNTKIGGWGDFIDYALRYYNGKVEIIPVYDSFNQYEGVNLAWLIEEPGKHYLKKVKSFLEKDIPEKQKIEKLDFLSMQYQM